MQLGDEMSDTEIRMEYSRKKFEDWKIKQALFKEMHKVKWFKLMRNKYNCKTTTVIRPQSYNCLRGFGYGDIHAWRNMGSIYSFYPHEKFTRYICLMCGIIFDHYYDVTPNIFSAMRASGIEDSCSCKNRIIVWNRIAAPLNGDSEND